MSAHSPLGSVVGAGRGSGDCSATRLTAFGGTTCAPAKRLRAPGEHSLGGLRATVVLAAKPPSGDESTPKGAGARRSLESLLCCRLGNGARAVAAPRLPWPTIGEGHLRYLDRASLKRRVPAAHQAHTRTYTHTPGLRWAACRAVLRLFDPQLLELLQLYQRYQLPKLLPLL